MLLDIKQTLFISSCVFKMMAGDYHTKVCALFCCRLHSTREKPFCDNESVKLCKLLMDS